MTIALAARHIALMKIYLHAPIKAIIRKVAAAIKHTIEQTLSNRILAICVFTEDKLRRIVNKFRRVVVVN